MKVLIVDDENLTRTGLISSVHWSLLGVDEVLEASDGMDGFYTALLKKPDIIISDVRMPRMTGIEMMQRIQAKMPDTVCIFMSGFSDREYLKAAIRLRAVSYVDKPLDIEEVENAIKDAIDRRQKISESREAESFQQTVSASHLAASLTQPYDSAGSHIGELLDTYCQRYGSPEDFSSAFTLILQVDGTSSLPSDFLKDTEAKIYTFIRSQHLHEIGVEKHPNLFVLHFFRRQPFTLQTASAVADHLAGALGSDFSYYIAIGSIVSGIRKLYDSYSSAVIRMQKAFFHAAGSILSASDQDSALLGDTSAFDRVIQSFQLLEDAAESGNEENARKICDELYHYCLNNDSLIRRSVQVRYYSMAAAIHSEWIRHQLPSDKGNELGNRILEEMEKSMSYPQLHSCLVRLLDGYFEELNNYVPENSSVYLIKSYIHSHYNDPMLSTKEISEYASLSASYACSVFKNETGQTLNQYLTEYRMEKAKDLLADPRNNVSEVAGKVGYNDSNYFGKAFKKYAGLSPSEFRESRG
ncbi:MAG: response regulator [Eubacterium sp.]|nr:response regulator [Eubacterium sp.]